MQEQERGSPAPLSKTFKDSVSTSIFMGLIFMALLSNFVYMIAGRGIGMAAVRLGCLSI